MAAVLAVVLEEVDAEVFVLVLVAVEEDVEEDMELEDDEVVWGCATGTDQAALFLSAAWAVGGMTV